MTMRINLPLTKEVAGTLVVGESVLLNGPVFTARDATHERLLADMKKLGKLPFNLEGQTIFYAGPTPASGGKAVGSIGPTTARRMDAATVELVHAGLAATLGKGTRSREIEDLCRETGTVYFGALGGTAALLAEQVTDASIVAYSDLGTEALMRLELHDFPAFVAIDPQGNNFYEQAPRLWRSQHQPTEKLLSKHTRFVSFEGGEGAGKSTHVKALARQLEMLGLRVRVVREPGSSAIGEKIRQILLDPANTELDAHAELLLYEAARAQVVREIVRPLLEDGVIVLCDRYFDSTTAYQGYGRGIDLSLVEQLNRAAVGDVIPDRTIVLDTSASTGLRRATKDGHMADRLERETAEFHERVRRGFLAIAQNDPERVRVVDANQPIIEVFAGVIRSVADLFPEMFKPSARESAAGAGRGPDGR